jgi:putative ABC transport system permease protein
VRRLSAIDIGVDSAGITAAFVNTRAVGYDATRAWRYFDEFAARLRSRPEVESVALATAAPFVRGFGAVITDLLPAGAKAAAPTQVATIRVLSQEYFSTLGIHVLRGRAFSEAELARPGRHGEQVIVLGAAAALRLFGSIDIVGRTVTTPRAPGERQQVIGIVEDVRLRDLIGEAAPVAYNVRALSANLSADTTPTDLTILVRTRNGDDIDEQIRAVAASLDSSLPVYTIESMDAAIGRVRFEWDLLARVLAGFSAVAILLSCLGVYGVVAFGVAARRHEFAIRIALGATAAHVRQLMVRQMLPLTAGGLMLGLAGGAGLAAVLHHRLIGVSAFNPAIWAAAVASLVTIVLLASFAPTRNASAANPAGTLRAE